MDHIQPFDEEDLQKIKEKEDNRKRVSEMLVNDENYFSPNDRAPES